MIVERAVRAREQRDRGRLVATLKLQGLQRRDGGGRLAGLQLQLRARELCARRPLGRDTLRELEPLISPIGGALQLRRVRGEQVVRERRVGVLQALRQ